MNAPVDIMNLILNIDAIHAAPQNLEGANLFQYACLQEVISSLLTSAPEAVAITLKMWSFLFNGLFIFGFGIYSQYWRFTRLQCMKLMTSNNWLLTSLTQFIKCWLRPKRINFGGSGKALFYFKTLFFYCLWHTPMGQSMREHSSHDNGFRFLKLWS